MNSHDRLFDVIYGDFWSKAYKFPEEGDFVTIPIKKTDGGRFRATDSSRWHNPVTDIFGKDNLIYARPDSYVWVDQAKTPRNP